MGDFPCNLQLLLSVTEDYLSDKFPMVEFDDNIFINASFLPDPELVKLISSLKPNQSINSGDDLVAFYSNQSQEEVDLDTFKKINFTTPIYCK